MNAANVESSAVPDRDMRRYREYLRSERDASALYHVLAQAEENPHLAEVYKRLGETESRHAVAWEQKIRDAGGDVPSPSIGWRARALGWLARRFGAAVVLPTVAETEQRAGSEYSGQPEPEAGAMAPDERSHARVFRYLAGQTNGLDGSAIARMEGRHRFSGGNALRAGVLGANDGLVSNLSLVMGVAGAEMQSRTILVTGVAGLLAGAISMALGEWLSVQSSRELYSHQIAIEKDEMARSPEEEKDELALIYQAKGIAPEEAAKLADRLLSDSVGALDTLAREELGIDPRELGGSAWEAAITSFALFALGAIVPVVPFFLASGVKAVLISAGLSAVGLFAIGAAITLVTAQGVLKSGLRQVFFGLVAAGVTFGIGHFVGARIGG